MNFAILAALTIKLSAAPIGADIDHPNKRTSDTETHAYGTGADVMGDTAILVCASGDGYCLAPERTEDGDIWSFERLTNWTP
jgi:hypothetical protein